MSYEITMRKANCLYEGVEDPVFVTITSSSSDVALLSRSDALELAAAHDMRVALLAIRGRPDEATKIFKREGFVFDDKGGRWEQLAMSLYTMLVINAEAAREVLLKAEGKEQA